MFSACFSLLRDPMFAGHIDLGSYCDPTFFISAAKEDVAVGGHCRPGQSFHIIAPIDAPTKMVADLKEKEVGRILGASVD
jgi:ABC-type nitrate/sulfonate/bicarbonate transport system substrate-binding protein